MKALRKPLFILAATVFVALMVNSAAQAQKTCGQRDAIVEAIKKTYGEVRRGAGLNFGAGAIYEIWASDATGTGTILQTFPNGVACVVAVGDGWHDELIPTGDGA